MWVERHISKRQVLVPYFFPSQPPLNTRRVVLMFTVYKDNILSLTEDEHLYKVELHATAVLFFWFWSCCLLCVECADQSLPKSGLTSLQQQRKQRCWQSGWLTCPSNQGQGLKKTGGDLRQQWKQNTHWPWIVSSLWDLTWRWWRNKFSFFFHRSTTDLIFDEMVTSTVLCFVV